MSETAQGSFRVWVLTLNQARDRAVEMLGVIGVPEPTTLEFEAKAYQLNNGDIHTVEWTVFWRLVS